MAPNALAMPGRGFQEDTPPGRVSSWKGVLLEGCPPGRGRVGSAEFEQRPETEQTQEGAKGVHAHFLAVPDEKGSKGAEPKRGKSGALPEKAAAEGVEQRQRQQAENETREGVEKLQAVRK